MSRYNDPVTHAKTVRQSHNLILSQLFNKYFHPATQRTLRRPSPALLTTPFPDPRAVTKGGQEGIATRRRGRKVRTMGYGEWVGTSLDKHMLPSLTFLPGLLLTTLPCRPPCVAWLQGHQRLAFLPPVEVRTTSNHLHSGHSRSRTSLEPRTARDRRGPVELSVRHFCVDVDVDTQPEPTSLG